MWGHSPLAPGHLSSEFEVRLLAMTAAVVFVVERTPGGDEMAAVYRDHLPTRLTSYKPKEPIIVAGKTLELNPIVYAVRLDKLPNGDELAAKPIDDLYRLYCWMRDDGKLPPPNLAEPPKEKAKQGVEHRDTFRFMPRPWDGRDLEQHPSAVYCAHCGDYLAPGHHQPGCPEHARHLASKRRPEPGGYIGLRNAR